MRWFTRARRSRFPDDMVPWLALLGRHALDPQGSDIDPDEIWPRVAALWPDATADRTGFLADLHALVAADRGGFATHGAARLAWELYGSEVLRLPAAWPLIDAGIDFKLARGLSTGHLTGYEMSRLVQRREGDAGRAHPTEKET